MVTYWLTIAVVLALPTRGSLSASGMIIGSVCVENIHPSSRCMTAVSDISAAHAVRHSRCKQLTTVAARTLFVLGWVLLFYFLYMYNYAAFCGWKNECTYCYYNRASYAVSFL